MSGTGTPVPEPSHLPFSRPACGARLLPLLTVLLLPPLTLAHGLDHDLDHDAPAPTVHQILTTWPLEPGVLIPLFLSVLLYGIGLRNLWSRRASFGKGIRPAHALSFTAGWLSLFLALATPLHPLGSYLFSAHMAQHEILMLVAAPLLVLGKPLIVFLHALPKPLAQKLAPWLSIPSSQPGIGDREPTTPSSNTPQATRHKPSVPLRTWHQILTFFTLPLVAWLTSAIILWTWHLPALFQATLHNDFIHALQHTSFLFSALLFWYALFEHRHRRLNYGLAVLYMFSTALHSGLLGAILTFARTLWYPAYAHTTQQFGLSPTDDQALGGLIMWVPACSIYILAGLALLAAYLKESDRRLSQTSPAKAHGWQSVGLPKTPGATP